MSGPRKLPRPKAAHPALVVVTLLVPVVAVAYGFWTRPPTGATAVAVIAFLVSVVAALVIFSARQAVWLDGTVLCVRILRWQRVDLARAQSVTLRSDGHGSATLIAKEGSQKVVLPLLSLHPGRRTGVPAWVCDGLADGLGRNPLPICVPIVELLRAQADHLQRGGEPASSPLAPLTSDALLRAAGTAGALGALLSFLN